MLTPKDLKGLAELDTDGWPIISFYLRINRKQAGEENYASTIRTLIRDAETGALAIDDPQRSAIQEDLKKIAQVTTDERVMGSHSVGIIASSGAGIWQVYHLPELSENTLKIGNSVYLTPLARVLDKYIKYCVVLLNKEKARLFLVSMGEIADYSEIFDQVPKKHEQGGWSQARLQRHHEDHVMRHLKRTAELTFDFYQREGFDHLIIGGPEEVASELPAYLHNYLKDRLLTTISLDVDTATSKEILEESLKIEQRWEEGKEREAVSLLEDQLGTKGQAVAGLEATLQAIQQGQVMTVLMDEDFKASGFRCTGCNSLTVKPEEACSLCNAPVLPVEDLVNALIAETLKQDGGIEFISVAGLRGEMNQYGEIAALLRYRSG